MPADDWRAATSPVGTLTTQRLLEGVFPALLATMQAMSSASGRSSRWQRLDAWQLRRDRILTKGVQSGERAIAGGKVGDQSHSIGITGTTPALLEAKALSEVIRQGHTSSHV